MTTALAHAPILARVEARERGGRLLGPVDGMPTLDEIIVDAWEGLAARRVARCPVCEDLMEPEFGAQARPIGGRCRSCRSRLG